MGFLDVEKYFNKNVGIILGGCLTVKNLGDKLQEIKVVWHQSSANAERYLHISGEETLETALQSLFQGDCMDNAYKFAYKWGAALAKQAIARNCMAG